MHPTARTCQSQDGFAQMMAAARCGMWLGSFQAPLPNTIAFSGFPKVVKQGLEQFPIARARSPPRTKIKERLAPSDPRPLKSREAYRSIRRVHVPWKRGERRAGQRLRQEPIALGQSPADSRRRESQRATGTTSETHTARLLLCAREVVRGPWRRLVTCRRLDTSQSWIVNENGQHDCVMSLHGEDEAFEYK